ncbi:MAG: hypothetical protein JWP19_2165 [Rhodoglobus sp.]|jgi:hypothetical protein|nr:hypothetical protein [Rhodoglobus sp.]
MPPPSEGTTHAVYARRTSGVAAYTGLRGAVNDCDASLGSANTGKLAMMDEHAASPHRQPQPARSSGLCAAFIELLPISGVSISVFDGAGRQSTICASDALAARLDELQFELGVGPHWDAMHTAAPVLVPQLQLASPAQWAPFASAAVELGVGALFAFPMVMGAVTVGVVDLYASAPHELDTHDLATAIRLTSGVVRQAVHAGMQSASDASIAEQSAPAMRREVHQATGMILVQLNSTATEAFARLRAYAFATERTVQDVAHDVVTWTLDFGDLPD